MTKQKEKFLICCINTLTDLIQIYNSPLLDPDRGPKKLQRKVMFDIHYYMCHHGCENILDMTKKSFTLCYDKETHITFCDED